MKFLKTTNFLSFSDILLSLNEDTFFCDRILLWLNDTLPFDFVDLPYSFLMRVHNEHDSFAAYIIISIINIYSSHFVSGIIK